MSQVSRGCTDSKVINNNTQEYDINDAEITVLTIHRRDIKSRGIYDKNTKCLQIGKSIMRHLGRKLLGRQVVVLPRSAVLFYNRRCSTQSGCINHG